MMRLVTPNHKQRFLIWCLGSVYLFGGLFYLGSGFKGILNLVVLYIALGIPALLFYSLLSDKKESEILAKNSERDSLFEEAVKVVGEYGTASASFLQRKLRIGYSRAAQLMNQLVAEGIVTPDDDDKGNDLKN